MSRLMFGQFYFHRVVSITKVFFFFSSMGKLRIILSENTGKSIYFTGCLKCPNCVQIKLNLSTILHKLNFYYDI